MNKHDPHQGEDRARLIVALVISVAILFGFNHFFEKPRLEAEQQKLALQKELAAASPSQAIAAPEVTPLRPRDEVVGDGVRVTIDGDKVKGTIALKGARLDDLLLKEHTVSVDSNAPVPLLSPSGTAGAFYAETGWVASAQTLVPTTDTVWSVKKGSPTTLASEGAPLVLQWDNGAGLVFERSFKLDRNYLFTITDRVINTGADKVDLSAYALTARNSLPVDYAGIFVHHEGPVERLDGKYEEISYGDLDDGETFEAKAKKGWLGFTDRYWMVTLLPPPDQVFDTRILGTKKGATGRHYQADIVFPTVSLAAGATAENEVSVFAGAKDLDIIHAYEKTKGFAKLDLTIDFGMWYLITKPFYFLLHLLADMTGSIAIAILLMTVIVRVATFPLSGKSFKSMARMKKVGPQLKELQEKYKDDKAKLQMEIFELYKRENVNPFSGCWPMLVQIPIFFALYKVILVSVELRHAPFWGWVDDLSAPDPTTIFNLFGLIPWQPPQLFMIGIWPILFCLTMIIQKRLSPPMPDPIQEKIQGYFPYFITVMLAHFASGLVIYWTWSNVLGILQQYYILKNIGGEETSLIRGHAARRKPKKHAAKKHGGGDHGKDKA